MSIFVKFVICRLRSVIKSLLISTEISNEIGPSHILPDFKSCVVTLKIRRNSMRFKIHVKALNMPNEVVANSVARGDDRSPDLTILPFFEFLLILTGRYILH